MHRIANTLAPCLPWALLALITLLPHDVRAEDPFVFEPPPTLLPTAAQLRDLENPPSEKTVLRTQTQRVLVTSSSPATLRVDGTVVGTTPQQLELPAGRRELWHVDSDALVGGIGALAGSVLLALGAAWVFDVDKHGLLFPVPESERDQRGISPLGVGLALLSAAVAVGGMVVLGLSRRRVGTTASTNATLAVRLVGEAGWHQVELRGTPAAGLPRLHFDAPHQRWQGKGKEKGWKLLQMRREKRD